MKAIMLSIQPKYCELIASGKKTVEVRKTVPKLETPFKCYIYETAKRILVGEHFEPSKSNANFLCGGKLHYIVKKDWRYGKGKVIGELVCDRVDAYEYSTIDGVDIDDDELLETMLDREEINIYANGKDLYGLHIANLKIYDKPKELGEFFTACHKFDERKIDVEPDIVADFTNLPFPDNSFYLVVFDPPHLLKVGENAWLKKKYGKLPENWKPLIRDGFHECMRVLKPNGTLIFKWNEIDIPTREIINAIGVEPLFGHRSGKQSKTHWLCFMKELNE